MPEPALPQPRPTFLPGAARLRRTYLDPFGRPYSGEITFTGAPRIETGTVIAPPAPVTARLDPSGALDVALPPGTYTAKALLRTADGLTVNDTTTITHPTGEPA